MALTGTIIDMEKASSGGTTKYDVELDLEDLEIANEANKTAIVTKVTSTEAALKTHNTAIETTLKNLIDAFEVNMETRLTKIDDRLDEMDDKFSKILGYSETDDLSTANFFSISGRFTRLDKKFSKILGYSDSDIDLNTPEAESIKGLIGDVTTLKGKADGEKADALSDKTLTGMLQTLNDKIGDVSTLKNPVMDDELVMGDPEDLETLTLAGIHQVINDKLGDPKEAKIMVGEVIDPTTGAVIKAPEELTYPDNIGALVGAAIANSTEAVNVEKDFRRRFMVPLYEAFKDIAKVMLGIAQNSPRI